MSFLLRVVSCKGLLKKLEIQVGGGSKMFAIRGGGGYAFFLE